VSRSTISLLEMRQLVGDVSAVDEESEDYDRIGNMSAMVSISCEIRRSSKLLSRDTKDAAIKARSQTNIESSGSKEVLHLQKLPPHWSATEVLRQSFHHKKSMQKVK